MKKISSQSESWSQWTECSAYCGSGFKTRVRNCFRGELNCQEKRVEQITCTKYTGCKINGNLFENYNKKYQKV